MPYVNPLPYDTASPEERARIDQLMEGNGRLTNMKLTLLNDVPSFTALMEWYRLRPVLLEFMTEQAFNFYCYAISTTNDCLICSMFFKQILVDQNIDFKTFEFNEEEQLLVDFGQAIAKDPKNVPEELFAKLKERYTDQQLTALVAFGTIMIATNLINEILHVDLDDRLIPYTQK